MGVAATLAPELVGHPARSRRRRTLILVAAAAAAAAAFVVAGSLPDLGRWSADVSHSLGVWAYVMVGVFAFVETAAFVGLVAPGETAVVAAGAAAAHGELDVVALVAVVWIAAAAGDGVSFVLGRRLGRPFIERHAAKARLTPARIARAERFYQRQGGKALLVGRFVGLLRAVTPFLAGASKVPARSLAAYSLGGTLAWAATFTVLGFAFAGSVAAASELATRIVALAVLALLAVVAVRGRLATRGSAEPASTPKSLRRGSPRSGRELLIVVNSRASGLASPTDVVGDIRAAAVAKGLAPELTVTGDEADLARALAAAEGRRVVLVGGDGSLHAALNAPLDMLPELALVPRGRANNVARALAIPPGLEDALDLAARGEARALDALEVRTPERSLLALEGLSAGFQADARSLYSAGNSGDLRGGLRALVTATRGYEGYAMAARVDGERFVSGRAAQLFVSNLPYFGYGFEVNPGADPSDGCFEAIVIEAMSRRALLARLAAARRGRHVSHDAVTRIRGSRFELDTAGPLVADSTPLGTTAATVTVNSGRLRLVAASGRGVR